MEQKQENVEDVIVAIVEDLLARMGFSASVETKKAESLDGAIICNIKTEDSSFLIGQYGLNLQSLQHIARVMIRKKIVQPINFILDVNSYRQEKNDSVIRLAKNLAQEAIIEKREITMRPMTAYERRIVHMELSKNDQIKSESIGEGESRRIVIGPLEIV
jgi:spoIIIJ-associated protein